MDDADVSTFTLRNPLFTKNEICALIDLIEEHKTVLLDRGTSTAACFAKETAWSAIHDSFNSQNVSYVRSTESLKLKWDNIKKSTRKKIKESCDTDPITSRVAKLLSENSLVHDSKANGNEEYSMDDEDQSVDIPTLKSTVDSNDCTTHNTDLDYLIFNKSGSNGSEQQSSFTKSLRNNISKDSIFTPAECDKLLICVKAEKQCVFNKETSARSAELKRKAWDRITAAFNKNRLHARSAKCLRKKFKSMKKLTTLQSHEQPDKTKTQSKSYNGPIEEITVSYNRLLKSENAESDISNDSIVDDDTSNTDNFLLAVLHDEDSNPHPDIASKAACDPLSSALNGFGESGANGHKKEIMKLVKMKLELTKHKLEISKESRRQKKEAHEALMASIAARNKLTELQTKRTELEIAALLADRAKFVQKNDTH